MPYRKLVRSVSCLFWLCVGLAAQLHEQSTFGTMLGTVSDTSGAQIAHAAVVITNVDENTTRVVETDARGEYQAANMKPGRFRVEITAPGFQQFTTTADAARGCVAERGQPLRERHHLQHRRDHERDADDLLRDRIGTHSQPADELARVRQYEPVQPRHDAAWRAER